MGKISQSDAATAARKIVEPINKKRSDIEREMQEYMTTCYKESLPAKILKAWKDSDICEYMYECSSLNVYGHGFNNRTIALIGKWPKVSASYYSNPRFDLTEEQAAFLQPLETEREELKKKYDTTMSEVENTILTLSTHKRVSEEFPEAYKFLPGVTRDTSLMVQLDPVREKVRCLTSDDKEKKCIENL